MSARINIDLNAIEARAEAANSGLTRHIEASAEDVPALIARVRELESVVGILRNQLAYERYDVDALIADAPKLGLAVSR